MSTQKVLSVGEILFDCYQQSGIRKLGGAPFNFAYHLNKIGFRTDFVSRVGQDPMGSEIVNYLRYRSFPSDYIQIDGEHETGNVLVTLDRNKIPDFKIVENVAYDFIEYPEGLQKEYDLIYYGSLSQRHVISRKTVKLIVRNFKSAKKFCDLNLRQNFYSRELITWCLENSDILKINEDELAVIASLLSFSGYPEKIVTEVAAKFRIEVISLTLGEKGSLLYRNGSFEKIDLVKGNVVDSVGAGDSYASMVCAGILLGWERKKFWKLLRIWLSESAAWRELFRIMTIFMRCWE